MTERSDAQRLRVLLSVRGPSPTTNPYVVQLADAVREHADVAFFSWRRGLLGSYDVLHVHWPEVMVRRAGRFARWAAQARFALLMCRTVVRRTAVVRTLHNVSSHEGGGRIERALMRWCDRRTVMWIRLNPDTPLPSDGASRVILHGHYVDWFARYPVEVVTAGALMTFGLIRPYKGTDTLLAAFHELRDPAARLRVVGRPTTDGLRLLVTEACREDPRIEATLDYVDDAVLAREISRAQLVVLPYRDMHNSGALLLALSLARPVLVPRTSTTVALAEEVGVQWVRTYDGALDTSILASALEDTAASPSGGPDLGNRGWAGIGEEHVSAYAWAVCRASGVDTALPVARP